MKNPVKSILKKVLIVLIVVLVLLQFYRPTKNISTEVPSSFSLEQNYPNPFNPTTTIRFGVPQEGKVKLVIYNVLGQKVKELVNESRSAGYHTMIWNGRSDNGHIVSSGVYLYRLETTQGTAVKKMMFVK